MDPLGRVTSPQFYRLTSDRRVLMDELLVIPLPAQGTLQFPHLLLFRRLISVHGQLGFLLLISVQ